MPSGDAVDFIYKQYTDDEGGTWSLKVDKTWGNHADADFGAFDPADPVMVKSPSLRPRMIFLQDPVTGRQTSRVCGSPTATAWTTAGYTSVQKFRGLAGTVAVTKYDKRGEHIRRGRAIVSLVEPSTA